MQNVSNAKKKNKKGRKEGGKERGGKEETQEKLIKRNTFSGYHVHGKWLLGSSLHHCIDLYIVDIPVFLILHINLIFEV